MKETEIVDSKVIDADFLTAVAKGRVKGHSIENKFGRSHSITTTFTPIASSGTWQTPTAATTLEAVSTDAGDNASGAGMRKIEVIGLDDSGNKISEVVTLNGLTPVTLSTQFFRVDRIIGKESGTYATATASSNIGRIIVRTQGGGAEWGDIDVVDGVGLGQSQIGVYSVPSGYTAFLLSKNISVESNKLITTMLLKRENILQVTAPFEPMRLQEMEDGISQAHAVDSKAALATITGPADIGFMAKVATGTASVSVDFQMLVVDNNYL